MMNLLNRPGDQPPPAVTTYTLSGPSTATVGLASDQFFVELGLGQQVSAVTITPDDGGAGGTLSLASVTLTDTHRIASFTYTPLAAGTVTISVTNDGGLTDPDPITLTVSDPLSPEELGHPPIVMLKPAATLWYRGVR